jgi:hypothetical protein
MMCENSLDKLVEKSAELLQSGGRDDDSAAIISRDLNDRNDSTISALYTPTPTFEGKYPPLQVNETHYLDYAKVTTARIFTQIQKNALLLHLQSGSAHKNKISCCKITKISRGIMNNSFNKELRKANRGQIVSQATTSQIHLERCYFSHKLYASCFCELGMRQVAIPADFDIFRHPFDGLRHCQLVHRAANFLTPEITEQTCNVCNIHYSFQYDEISVALNTEMVGCC